MTRTSILLAGAMLAFSAVAQDVDAPRGEFRKPGGSRVERRDFPGRTAPGGRPEMLIVTDQTDDAAVEAYKSAILAKIDEAVAKYRQEGQNSKDGAIRAPLRLMFFANGRGGANANPRRPGGRSRPVRGKDRPNRGPRQGDDGEIQPQE